MKSSWYVSRKDESPDFGFLKLHSNGYFKPFNMNCNYTSVVLNLTTVASSGCSKFGLSLPFPKTQKDNNLLKLFQREKFTSIELGKDRFDRPELSLSSLFGRTETIPFGEVKIWPSLDTLQTSKQNPALKRHHIVMGIRRFNANENFKTFDNELLEYENWGIQYPENYTQGELLPTIRHQDIFMLTSKLHLKMGIVNLAPKMPI